MLSKHSTPGLGDFLEGFLSGRGTGECRCFWKGVRAAFPSRGGGDLPQDWDIATAEARARGYQYSLHGMLKKLKAASSISHVIPLWAPGSRDCCVGRVRKLDASQRKHCNPQDFEE